MLLCHFHFPLASLQGIWALRHFGVQSTIQNRLKFRISLLSGVQSKFQSKIGQSFGLVWSTPRSANRDVSESLTSGRKPKCNCYRKPVNEFFTLPNGISCAICGFEIGIVENSARFVYILPYIFLKEIRIIFCVSLYIFWARKDIKICKKKFYFLFIGTLFAL